LEKCKATVNEQFQIQDLQVFYDLNQLFTQLTEISPFVKLPNSHPPTAKKSIEQGETNNNINPLSRKANAIIDRKCVLLSNISFELICKDLSTFI
jgi:hypothetical protein